MSQSIQVSASILCADFTRLGEEVVRCVEAGVDILHIDVMDGHFVPNITIGPMIVSAVRRLTSLPIEAHLMIEHPGRYIDAFIESGADVISLHAECYGTRRPKCRAFDAYPKEIDVIDPEQARKDILRIKNKGKKAFMVLNPGTPVCLGPVLKDLDGVLVMSVHPGFAGQKFMPEALAKITELRRVFDGDIAVDGGINAETSGPAVAAGANILATASFLFGAKDPQERVRYLKSLKKLFPAH